MITRIKSKQTLEGRKFWLQTAKQHKMVHLLYIIDNILKAREFNMPSGKTKDTKEPMGGLDFWMTSCKNEQFVLTFLTQWEYYLKQNNVTFKNSYNKIIL